MRKYLLFLPILLLGSCSVNSDLMYKTPKGYVFDEIPEKVEEEYKLSADDRLSFRLFTNQGHTLIDFSSGENNFRGGQAFGANNFVTYLVEQDGRVELPTLGRINVAGKTILEIEFMLEEMYKKYYKDPFVMLNVVNQRVIVSTGTGGSSAVINLTNNNTTVIEAIALAGGIVDRGNASIIKVIRRDGDDFKVFKIDLSNINGVKDGNMIVQAEDIIYVEPTPQIASEVLRDVAPIISLISSAIFIITVVNAN